MAASSPASPVNFSIAQRAVHWATVLLIAWQFIAASGFDAAKEARKAGAALDGFSAFLIQSHFITGFVLLALVICRLWLRFTQGVPAEPANEPPVLKLLAKITHIGLYVVLFAMPLSGIAFKYLGLSFAHDPHVGPLKGLMILLIALHVAGALVHQFIWKTDVLARMTRGV
ncbi:cytochrome b [Allorhizobium borbori]|uniref:Cytochrome b561 n=1 Tax=Allorhizobium borbori TaxID=485907 RepID=A0A7W6K2A6_9HYPH|nr:cytochrome b/b6 domain-containing protein [Allorhizobium borbori]MBB4103905.1 cytochrome b561 [Allorhizobium borbori]